ncbi:hypothetical protein MNBD_GAMMA17-1690 [hydrothermal vent metagenome]|uniref:RES domain-containing protein n=1 Tax=hydrothermal vent metagenome TaxID=652676 RepID=A0A3B0ZSG3_9ZZZZ
MICAACVFKQSMKDFIKVSGASSKCDYCAAMGVCVEDLMIFGFMKERVLNILVQTSELSDYEQAMIFEGGAAEPPVFELLEFFGEYSEFAVDEFMGNFDEALSDGTGGPDESGLFALDDGSLDELNEFEIRWDKFIHSIHHQRRFFNEDVRRFCDDLFDAISIGDALEAVLIYTVKDSELLYRARIPANREDIETIAADPIKQLGPVPAVLAGSQRMTSSGVSSFYAAFDRDTCLSELRPIVGDAVISGEFRPNRELRLLDLNALTTLPKPDDVFADDYLNKSHARAFFSELVFQLSRPSGRNTQQDYLATQVVFEYLSLRFGGQVHGIKYSSVQKNGAAECVALFPEYSSVKVDSDQVDTNTIFPESAKPAMLFFVPESLRFHRVKSVSYEGTEDDSVLDLTTSDRIMKRLFPEKRC